MNLTKTFSPPARAAICLLLLAVSLPAQDDTSAAKKKSDTEALTNAVAPKPLVGDSDTISNAAPANAADEETQSTNQRSRRYRGPLVIFGRDAALKAGDSA